jgi:CRP-like cAMP-binding protein
MSAITEYLSNVSLFDRFSKTELTRIAQATTELRIGADQVLMREGSIGHEMVIVVAGRLSVRRAGQVIGDIGPGSTAGEVALLNDLPRNATVVTATEVVLLHVDRRDLRSLLEDVPALAARLAPIAATRAA